jgi:hypothetical protein
MSTTSTRPFSAVTRQENMERLAQAEFDLLIIGGGITGVAIARDAAMRGFRTALGCARSLRDWCARCHFSGLSIEGRDRLPGNPVSG